MQASQAREREFHCNKKLENRRGRSIHKKSDKLYYILHCILYRVYSWIIKQWRIIIVHQYSHILFNNTTSVAKTSEPEDEQLYNVAHIIYICMMPKPLDT